MKGGYALLIELPEEQDIAVGKLGLITFPKGFYAYIGSAMNGFELRIGHHLRRKRRFHWHIDYLLQNAEIREIILCEAEQRVECILAHSLAKEFPSIPGFGSSDCNCSSHLFWGTEKALKAGIISAAKQVGLTYAIFSTREVRASFLNRPICHCGEPISASSCNNLQCLI